MLKLAHHWVISRVPQFYVFVQIWKLRFYENPRKFSSVSATDMMINYEYLYYCCDVLRLSGE